MCGPKQGELEQPDVLAAVSGLCGALRRAARLLCEAREAEMLVLAGQPDADVSSMDCEGHEPDVPIEPPIEPLDHWRMLFEAERAACGARFGKACCGEEGQAAMAEISARFFSKMPAANAGAIVVA